MLFARTWAMPTPNTFDCPPIAGFVQKYLLKSRVSVDPFARNRQWFTHTNDLDPGTGARHHMDAEDFLIELANCGVQADLVIFDPPYSPGQIIECYRSIGMEDPRAKMNGELYSRVRKAVPAVLSEDGIVLSFGWNSAGMGLKHGFEPIEILLVCHGAAHNDTICVAEKRKITCQLSLGC